MCRVGGGAAVAQGERCAADGCLINAGVRARELELDTHRHRGPGVCCQHQQTDKRTGRD